MRHWLQTTGLVLWLAMVWVVPAKAQNYTVTSVSTVALGNVAAAASGTTTFTVNPATGAITKSGNGAIIGAASGRSLVTVSCSGGSCGSNNVAITVAATGTPTGRAGSLQNFTVSVAGATASIVTGPGTGNPISFTIGPIPNNGNRTFYVGFDFPINSTGTTGSASSNFVVTAARPAGGGSSTATGSATANVFRAITISKTADMAFGKIVRPSTGSGTVSLTAAGVRTVTGTGTFALPSPSPTAAAFSVNGEGGQAITVSIPTSFPMISGANSLTVTTASTGGGVQTLNNSLGNGGTPPTAITVGGSFPFSSTTPTGTYSGTISVTVQYN